MSFWRLAGGRFARLTHPLDKIAEQREKLNRELHDEAFNLQTILASMEEGVMVVHTRAPRRDLHTGIDTRGIARTSRLVSRLTGYPVQPNKAIIGRNAFAHESGIHQDGVLKERSTFEIMDATAIGLDSNQLVLGKHSGR